MTEILEVEMPDDDDDDENALDVVEPETVWLEARVVAIGGAAS